MIKRFLTLAAALGLAAAATGASAQTMMSSSSPMQHGAMMGSGTTMHGLMPATGPDHGMPAGTMGGDGHIYTGKPDLDAAVSLVVAGGTPGNFSIVKALTALAGPKVTAAEAAKLKKQYGSAAFDRFVSVQNFAVNDAVARATKAGVKFPKPTLKGAALAKKITLLGLYDGTYYEGYMLDHIVTHPIHELVMDDIDKTFGVASDANYHRIADQAHYDLAQALGATSVKLAAYH